MVDADAFSGSDVRVAVNNLRRDASCLIERMKAFDFTPVRTRFCRDHPAVPNPELVEKEFLRWFTLVALVPEKPLPMAGTVDEYWHTFLLFTRNYREFCLTFCGRFVDHVPEVSVARSWSDVLLQTSEIERFLGLYRIAYNEVAPPGVWPFRSHTVVHDPMRTALPFSTA